ncbi:hypothetical protein AG1IA_04112 [Rhizoctonia solani AG-1 IA]|uniref:Uncharacterized protein n=1 Tax=Thanatephorus cucumeris (strain AG1-IA) TaxID=983506 RepID=L8WUR6_THACA|nr:hypothetical protein AG1IA_04112 [Rhizoctonia solani AG-1 IA]
MWSSVIERLQLGHQKVVVEPPTKLATFQTLLRMANTRRLVTSLVRLLATKSEVIGQLRKRLQGGPGGAVDWDEGDMARGQEVGIYLGDVQGMHHAQNVSERLVTNAVDRSYLNHATGVCTEQISMLTSCNDIRPAHLRLLLSEAKGGKDKMILILSVIIFTVPAMQLPIGLGGMNVNIPSQRDTPYYDYFFVWLGVTIGVMFAIFLLVWWWWILAKKKRRTNAKL